MKQEEIESFAEALLENIELAASAVLQKPAGTTIRLMLIASLHNDPQIKKVLRHAVEQTYLTRRQ